MPSAQGRPPFRADHVGSLLRPQILRQAFRQHASREIGDAEFKKLQDECIRDVVTLQESVGLNVVTDGEYPLLSLLPGRDMDPWRLRAMELQRVADQILKDLFEPYSVARYDR